MKTKIKLTIILFSILTNCIYAQLKILNTGNVGIGTNTPFSKLEVLGQVNITGSGKALRFIADNPGPEIGSSDGTLNFWHTTGLWTNIYAKHYYIASDSSLKKNIVLLKDCSSIIKKLNGYKYQFIQTNSKASSEKYDFGLLAQEVERVAPELVSETKGLKAVDYIGLIPIIIESMKEQQKIVENSNKKIDSLSNVISQCCSSNQSNQQSQNQQSQNNGSSNTNSNTANVIHSKGKLYQNTPNPFNNETKIEYELTETTQSASIAVFDLQGNFKKSYSLGSNKKGSIIIQAGEFNQGMYIYTLIIDQQEIDSKKMILME